MAQVRAEMEARIERLEHENRMMRAAERREDEGEGRRVGELEDEVEE